MKLEMDEKTMESAQKIIDGAGEEELAVINLFSDWIDDGMIGANDEEGRKAAEVFRACWTMDGYDLEEQSLLSKLYLCFRAGMHQGFCMAADMIDDSKAE